MNEKNGTKTQLFDKCTRLLGDYIAYWFSLSGYCFISHFCDLERNLETTGVYFGLLSYLDKLFWPPS